MPHQGPSSNNHADATGTNWQSHRDTIDQFNVPAVAAKYPASFGSSFRARRERACLLTAIRTLPAGSHVLDIPCGTGRLTRLLVDAGMIVTGADSSPQMVDLARGNWEASEADRPIAGEQVRFEVRDVVQTGYPDQCFDAVLCNRLFHHFRNSSVRVAALSELRRICRGSIIVSFFNSFAVDGVRFRLKHWLRGTEPTDRIPIPLQEFKNDLETAGLIAESAIPVMWGISPMWYLIMKPQPDSRLPVLRIAA